MENITTKNIITELRKISEKGFNIKEVFNSFMEVSAVSIYNSFHKDCELEKQYLASVNKYGKEAMYSFSKCFAILVELMEREYQDYLGQIACELETLDSKGKGQVFTPPEVAKFMVKATLKEDKHLSQILKNPNKYIKILEPTAGTGALLVAIAKTTVEEFKLNFQDKIWLTAWELDSSIFYGLYFQASIMGFSANIINGDSLTSNKYKEWVTPVGFIKGHNFRRRFYKMQRMDTIKEYIRNKAIRKVAELIYSISKSKGIKTYKKVRLILISSNFKQCVNISTKVKKEFISRLEVLDSKVIGDLSEIVKDLK